MGKLKDQMVDHMVLNGYSERTIENYTGCVSVFAHFFNKSPLEISIEEVTRFFLHLRESKKSEATVHLYYFALRYFYKMHKVVGRMPQIRLKRSNKVPPVFSKNEVGALLGECTSYRYKALFSIIYSAGLRISEALNLRIEDIDYDRKQIYVRRAKNNKDRFTLLANTTMNELCFYLKMYKPTSILFYSGVEKDKKMSQDTVRKEFKRILYNAGIRKKAFVHTLRHSFATHLLDSGTSLFHIMKLLGHSHISTTLRYLHMQDLSELRVTSPLDSVMSSASKNTLYNHQLTLIKTA